MGLGECGSQSDGPTGIGDCLGVLAEGQQGRGPVGQEDCGLIIDILSRGVIIG